MSRPIPLIIEGWRFQRENDGCLIAIGPPDGGLIPQAWIDDNGFGAVSHWRVPLAVVRFLIDDAGHR